MYKINDKNRAEKIIRKSIELIQSQQGAQISIQDIPLNDAATISLFQQWRTIGVCGFETSKMFQCLRDFRPTDFQQIATLYRIYYSEQREQIPQLIKEGKMTATLDPEVMEYVEVAYRSAYLKAHYPEEFMQAVVECNHDNPNWLDTYLSECKRMGIRK